eukprot:CAMPEP_0201552636 /NCGR_PEP_ID=MMETSP0173_2-20130828/16829_1 /ASSEMBLY_ACC=CAM_ASM_000268 /TAXON_ID=218659 /ORGANISM="Vexillifera sp., Strain DIVA3 564/2" /LENGTH=270 /DNA_ID=CAMNT_0047963147 /DNA_START=386 /DNA_END=1194 /DNA_ORIENTATION=-
MTFSRKVNTGDYVADWPISLRENMRVIFAWGETNTFGYHRSNRGTVVINFASGFTAAGQDHGNLRYWHGMLMTLSFGVLMTFAVFASRYLKQLWWWFPFHWGMITVCLLAAISAFVIIFVYIEDNNAQHFANPHAVVGLVTLILSVLSALFGGAAHFLWKPSRTTTPWFPDRAHHWIGRCTLLLSWVAITLGAHQLALDDATIYITSGLWVYFIIVFVSIELSVFLHQSSPTTRGDHDDLKLSLDAEQVNYDEKSALLDQQPGNIIKKRT